MLDTKRFRASFDPLQPTNRLSNQIDPRPAKAVPIRLPSSAVVMASIVRKLTIRWTDRREIFGCLGVGISHLAHLFETDRVTLEPAVADDALD